MPSYLDLKVTLQGSKPPVWRRMLFSGAATFEDLHLAIQGTFNWDDDHRHLFRADGRDGTPFAGPGDGRPGRRPELADEQLVRLDAFFGAPAGGTSCVYVYDPGNDWRHRVRLMGTVTEDERYAWRLVGQSRARPPGE